MSQNTGTLVIAPIRPSSSLDQFATAFANEIKGGFHTVEDITERNAISSDRRMEGMLCYVVEETKIYQLQGGITNDDWEEFSVGGESLWEESGDSIQPKDLSKGLRLFNDNPFTIEQNGDDVTVIGSEEDSTIIKNGALFLSSGGGGLEPLNPVFNGYANADDPSNKFIIDFASPNGLMSDDHEFVKALVDIVDDELIFNKNLSHALLGNQIRMGFDIESFFDEDPEVKLKCLINIGNNINVTENGFAIGQNITTNYGIACGVNINTNGSAVFGGYVTGNGATALGFFIDADNRGSALGREIVLDGEQNIGVGVDLAVTGDYSLAIGNDITIIGDNSLCIGYGGSVLNDNSSVIGGIANQNKGEFSSIIGGSYNEIDTLGEYSNIISSLQCYAEGFGSWVSGSLGCSATDGSVILNSIMTETKGLGAMSIASYTGYVDGFGSWLLETTGCYVEGIGSALINSLYSSVIADKSLTINSDYTYITDMFSMSFNGQENTISKPFSLAFGNVINVMASNSVGFNLDLLPIEICQDNTMAIMNGKLGVGLCDPSVEFEVVGNIKANVGLGANTKTELKTFDLNALAPNFELNATIFSGETTNTYETALFNYLNIFKGDIIAMANDTVKFGKYPDTVANTGTGTDWTSLDNVKTKDTNPTMWTSDDITVDSYEITDAVFPVGGNFKKVGQTFNSDEPNIISKVELKLSNGMSATGNAVVKIYEIFDAYGLTSIPYGDVLATSDVVDVSTIGNTSEWVEFTFTNRIRLGGNNHKYALVLEYDGGGDGFIGWSQDTTTLTHSGNGFAEIDSVWTGNPDWDFTFRVEGSPNITIEKIQLVKNGTPVGDDKAQSLSLPLSAESMVWGGESDLWGTTWVSTDFATLSADVEVKTSANTSKTLRLTFADLGLPAVDVKGIKIEIYGNQTAGNALLFYAVATAYVEVIENPSIVWSAPELTDGFASIFLNLDTLNLEATTNLCPDSEAYGAFHHSLGQDNLKWKDLFVRDKIKIGDTELTESDLIALKALI